MKILAYMVGILALLCAVSTVDARPFTDSAGRTVEIPDSIGKVLAAGPPASVIVYTLAPQKLAGWVREPGETDKTFLLPETRALPTYGRLTGKGGTANVEAVIAARPDLIIDVGTINDTYISLADKVQQQTGIPYILIDGSILKTADTYRLTGNLLGVPDRAADLADYADKVLRDVRTIASQIPEKNRPRVYYGRGPDGMETGLKNSINVEILEVAGAVNAAAAGTGGLTNVSLEQILQWNPETILASDKSFAKEVAGDDRWAGVAAIKAHRVFTTPSSPFGWFDTPPGVNRLIGILWLEHLFYPAEAEGNLRNEVKQFYKLFYQVDVSDQQLDELLDGALPRTP
ncbi:ABC transporter substrate-binding protein [Phyllobacterium sp. SB3]|uniref:ABC transporter substrate-binding protein n=1 Tax=Phyllobacterium sp. SB3 TaxID=3156073 RepID=UPI0032AE8A0D